MTFNLSDKAYCLNQLRYDLRKLKGHGLLERDGNRYAYRGLDRGSFERQGIDFEVSERYGARTLRGDGRRSA
jgi:hypothetical protein